ncbi:hypothetical protein Hdeb2414_s0025g00656381 [Helianthus debilis subsp. tardiflorus]
MQAAARGGWLGQTFALAKHHDSFDGKKSGGIRRSKEERKGMVETFIKRYQKSNNGDFPSLNLTRKEVGGSFYTVREIVREIIQENRVLGPPKSPSGDHNMENLNSFLEHHPQETQIQHESEFVFINENVLNLPNNEAFENLKNGELSMEEQKVHEVVANGTQNHQIIEEVDKNLEEEMIHPPQESKSKSKLEMEEQKVHEVVANGTQNHQIIEEVDKNLEEEMIHPLQESKSKLEMEEQKVHEVIANRTQNHQIIEEVDKNLEEEMIHPLQESKSKSKLESQKGQAPSSTKENLVFNVNGSADVQLEDTLLSEQKTINGRTKTSCNLVQEPTLEERLANLNQSSSQPGSSPQNRITTLNRVDLKSWKAVSRKASGRETHQVVKFIRSFITAFVKFWSE